MENYCLGVSTNDSVIVGRSILDDLLQKYFAMIAIFYNITKPGHLTLTEYSQIY